MGAAVGQACVYLTPVLVPGKLMVEQHTSARKQLLAPLAVAKE